MKKIFIIAILLLSITSIAQTNKGYYYGAVGDVKLPNRTTDLKAFTDVYEYLEKNNLEEGFVHRPLLEVKRKKSSITPEKIIDTVIIKETVIVRDTVYITSDISVGNQWMGDPIVDIKVRGNIIVDEGGSHSHYGQPEVVFDGDINTFRRAHNQSSAWIGMDFEEVTQMSKIRIYHNPQFNTTTSTLEGALIQTSNNKTRWSTIHTMANVKSNEWYELTLNNVSARYFRIITTKNRTYGGNISEIEFYKKAQ